MASDLSIYIKSSASCAYCFNVLVPANLSTSITTLSALLSDLKRGSPSSDCIFQTKTKIYANPDSCFPPSLPVDSFKKLIFNKSLKKYIELQWQYQNSTTPYALRLLTGNPNSDGFYFSDVNWAWIIDSTIMSDHPGTFAKIFPGELGCPGFATSDWAPTTFDAVSSIQIYSTLFNASDDKYYPYCFNIGLDYFYGNFSTISAAFNRLHGDKHPVSLAISAKNNPFNFPTTVSDAVLQIWRPNNTSDYVLRLSWGSDSHRLEGYFFNGDSDLVPDQYAAHLGSIVHEFEKLDEYRKFEIFTTPSCVSGDPITLSTQTSDALNVTLPSHMTDEEFSDVVAGIAAQATPGQKITVNNIDAAQVAAATPTLGTAAWEKVDINNRGSLLTLELSFSDHPVADPSYVGLYNASIKTPISALLLSVTKDNTPEFVNVNPATFANQPVAISGITDITTNRIVNIRGAGFTIAYNLDQKPYPTIGITDGGGNNILAPYPITVGVTLENGVVVFTFPKTTSDATPSIPKTVVKAASNNFLLIFFVMIGIIGLVIAFFMVLFGARS